MAKLGSYIFLEHHLLGIKLWRINCLWLNFWNAFHSFIAFHFYIIGCKHCSFAWSLILNADFTSTKLICIFCDICLLVLISVSYRSNRYFCYSIGICSSSWVSTFYLAISLRLQISNKIALIVKSTIFECLTVAKYFIEMSWFSSLFA